MRAFILPTLRSMFTICPFPMSRFAFTCSGWNPTLKRESVSRKDERSNFSKKGMSSCPHNFNTTIKSTNLVVVAEKAMIMMMISIIQM